MQAVAGHTYAQIVSGAVYSVFTASQLPAWNDSQIAAVDITGVSPAPQPGWTATNTAGSWSFTAPAAAPAPTLPEQAIGLLAAGLAIASTGTPAVNGTYACDPLSQARMTSVVAGISAASNFPGGGSTFKWMLPSGSTVTFPSTALFLEVATGVRDFVYNCEQVIFGQSSSLPSASVTIA